MLIAAALLYPPENPNEFADALVRLANNSTKRLGMSANARKLAESTFDRLDFGGAVC